MLIKKKTLLDYVWLMAIGFGCVLLASSVALAQEVTTGDAVTTSLTPASIRERVQDRRQTRGENIRDRVSNLTPEQREQRFKNLNPQQKRRVWNSLNPQQKRRVWNSLNPQQQQNFRRHQLVRQNRAGRIDNDNNPPGPRGGRGTNWENPPGPRGGPGASPDRRPRITDRPARANRVQRARRVNRARRRR